MHNEINHYLTVVFRIKLFQYPRNNKFLFIEQLYTCSYYIIIYNNP